MSITAVSLNGVYLKACFSKALSSSLSYHWLSTRNVNPHSVVLQCDGPSGIKDLTGTVDIVYRTDVDLVIGTEMAQAYSTTSTTLFGRKTASTRCAEVLLFAVDSLPPSSVRHTDTGRSYVSGTWLDANSPASSFASTVHLPATLSGRFGRTNVLMPFAVRRDLSFDFVVGLDARAYYHETFPLPPLPPPRDIPRQRQVSGSPAESVEISQGTKVPVEISQGTDLPAGHSQSTNMHAEPIAHLEYPSILHPLPLGNTSPEAGPSSTPRRVLDVSEYQRDSHIGKACESMFLGRAETGLHTKFLSKNISVLNSALATHGIEPQGTLAIGRSILLTHFLTGQCVASRHHSVNTATACSSLRPGFDTMSEFSLVVLRYLVSSENTNLSRIFKDCVASLGLQAKSRAASSKRPPLKKMLNDHILELQRLQDAAILNILPNLSLHVLTTIAKFHGINTVGLVDKDHFHRAVNRHFATGTCLQLVSDSYTVQPVDYGLSNDDDGTAFRLCSSRMQETVKNLKVKSLRVVMDAHNIDMPEPRSDNKPHNARRLRKAISHHFQSLARGKRFSLFKANLLTDRDVAKKLHADTQCADRQTIHDSWPQIPSDIEKTELRSAFMEETGSKALKTFTCCSCSARHKSVARSTVHAHDIDLSVLTCGEGHWPGTTIALPYTEGPLANVQLDPDGVDMANPLNPLLSFCLPCVRSIRRRKTPRLSLANGTFLGDVPNELRDLTAIEESMIALCRAKVTIIQLQEERSFDSSANHPGTQRGFKGNIIIFPQEPSAIAQLLPPSIEDITSPLCVIFVGSQKPTMEWLQKYAKPLAVNGARVRRALIWLKNNNHLYKDIVINTTVLAELEANPILPVPITHVLPSEAGETLTSRYDSALEPGLTQDEEPKEIIFDKVVISSLSGGESALNLKQSAMAHIHENQGGYLSVSHDPSPANEFGQPALYPMMYPTLFPYGIGGLQDSERDVPLSMKSHVTHLFNLNDKRFQEHGSFLFTAFNMIQRHHLLLFTHLRVKRSEFPNVAKAFANVSSAAIESVMARMSGGSDVAPQTAEEMQVLKLMREVKAITAKVPGTASARSSMRNEIRGMIVDKGLPSFYLTLNPSDTYNPVVKFLSKEDIDVDNLLLDEVPKYASQSVLVAKNPFLAAKFFDNYLSAFFKTVLSFDPKAEGMNMGALGHTKAYYGCVEAQGRGTLHCHLMVWLEGSLNPDEIKKRIIDGDVEFRDRLLSFLDDTISTSVPKMTDCEGIIPVSETVHPSSVRGHQVPNTNEELDSKLRTRDMHNLVKKCQVHSHTKTCFKYCSPREPRVCRFDLAEENTCESSSFDYDTGELSLRCLDGLVNDFNDTIMQCVRCNMDIKFIGSGASAKAVLYYITDYITKSQLTTHVAYAALAEAVKKLEIHDPEEDELTVRGKKLIQKCAYSMLNRQELSAQQVASYVLDLPDHYTSHEFNPLYWLGFERIVNMAFEPSVTDPNETTDKDLDGDTNMIDLDETVPLPSIAHESGGERAEEENHEDDPEPSTSTPFEEEQEVIISRDSEGNLTTRSSKYADYLGRGASLNDLTLWEYTARIQKRKIYSKPTLPPTEFEDDYDNTTDEEDIDNVGETPECQEDEWPSLPLALAHTGRFRPVFQFDKDHPDFTTYKQIMCLPHKRKIPVPIGPAIPRRDNPSVYERYCCLMLILFKPWTSPAELRNTNQSWADAFKDFVPSPHVQAVINNMQILHECKDSRDDHFNNRKNRIHSSVLFSSAGSNVYDDDFQGEYDEDAAIAQHMIDMTRTLSERKLNMSLSSQAAVLAATSGGLFLKENPAPSELPVDTDTTAPTSPTSTKITPVVDTSTWKEELLTTIDQEREPRWSLDYEGRRSEARKVMMRTDKATISQEQEKLKKLSAARIESQIITDGITPHPAAVLQSSVPNTTSVEASFVEKAPLPDPVDIEAVIAKWTLTAQQAYAFRLIVDHSLKSGPTPRAPLRMFLNGQGGTGKSHILDAVKDFFSRGGESRRLRLTSFTGVAARNIKGTTLHSALFFSQHKKENRSKTVEDLTAAWRGVDFLFIDEVSMIGTLFLKKIHDALVEAKGNDEAFGGINIIFSGDFAQLAPVLDSKLYGHMPDTASQLVQNRLQGKLLWYAVDTVVTLQVNMRQSEDTWFAELLQRARQGHCTQEDYRLLQTRILSKANRPAGTFTPIIVTNNEAKDALNRKSAEAFARRTGRPLNYYHSEDIHNKKPVTHAVTDLLMETNSGQTENRMTALPLVLGMPVMVTQNFDVPGGVVNGSTGILEGIRYRTDSEGRRILVSCIVNVKDADSATLVHLSPGRAAIMPDTVDMTFVHPHSKARLTIKRTQVPIMPGFAMTAHKAQGQTMDVAVIDLHDCSGSESPYVMLSRIKTLQGLFILRSFDIKKIQCRRSMDYRRETARLRILELKTLTRHGNVVEKLSASDSLTAINSDSREISSGSSADQRTQRNLEAIQTQLYRLDRIEGRLLSERGSKKRKSVDGSSNPSKKLKIMIPPPSSKR